MNFEPGTRATILTHYYRAMVGRADTWRMRMDSTSHWAIGATAAVISFALGNPAAPHYVVHVAAFLTLIFLLLEARRLTFYHLWQQRVLWLERALVAPAVAPEEADDAKWAEFSGDLLPALGTTVPEMPLARAAARRLRRVYVYLFGVQMLAWLLKLGSQPTAADSARELVARAHVGPLPGAAMVGISVAGLAVAIGLAVSRGGVSRSA